MRIDGSQLQRLTINGVEVKGRVLSISYSVPPSPALIMTTRAEGSLMLELTPETRQFLARLASWGDRSRRKAKRQARMARKRRRGWA